MTVKKGTVGELMEEEKRREAIGFASSGRGLFIISQALYVAIQAMEKVPKIKREPSNIADMRFLMNTLFPMYKHIKEAEKKFEEHSKKEKEK
jgi:hypothetical protein